MNRSFLSVGRPALIPLVVLLTACSGEVARDTTFQSAAGQVKPASTVSVTKFAAARFAEQATFGPNPEVVAQIQAKGFSKWIDDEFALPVSQMDTSPIVKYNSQIPELSKSAYKYARNEIVVSLSQAPDQLRRRVAWSLSQFITTAINKIEPYGGMSYSNFLQRNAFIDFGTLIRRVTLNPSMAAYLDNFQNRPTTPECPFCSPNENYARELLQLFTLGTIKLNQDGTPQRDSKGRLLETYTQQDVEELARALTGWSFQYNPEQTDYRRFDGEMVYDTGSGSVAHDRGAKTVLGTSIPANLDASKELDQVVSIIMGHPNLAPFISTRLIQHLVTSEPTPAYVGRISAVFDNNGKGVKGDMKAVVKAILLDEEARRGDVPGASTANFGKMREPILWYTGLLRGLNCAKPLQWEDAGWGPMQPVSQMPFDPSSVFSYYAPTDRAPGSNLLAPEQKLLTAEEFGFRFGIRQAAFATAGCNLGIFGQALANNPAAFVDLVGDRFFRGAIPAALRQTLIALAPEIQGNTPNDRALTLLIFSLSSPYYGVMK
ncbi:MAG: DUF1800 domain-containing protein [Pseudomonadota bacterium]